MSKSVTQAARDLRNNLTEAEKYLWYALRLNNLEVKFRRQAVIGWYIADFACFEKKLVIEVDGGQHADKQEDKVRDQLSPSLTLPTGGREPRLPELSVKKEDKKIKS